MDKNEKNNKRKRWTKSETRLFLSCYKARKEEFCQSRRKRNGYGQVLQDMISQGFKDTSLVASSLEGKMRTLLHTYKTAKDSARQSGKRCKAPFMAELDDIFCEKTIERNGPTVTFKETVHIPSGKAKKRTNTCRLCIKKCNEYKCLFDETGRANTVYSTTIKYFDPMHLNLTQEHPNQEIAICLQCWSRICEFDSFKYSVLMAQNTISEIKPTTDDGKKLERYFGKQEGYDPLAVSVTIKNEADIDIDESEGINYSDDDMSTDDVVQDDASVSDAESDQHLEENEDSIQSADTNNECTEKSNTLSDPDVIDQPRAEVKKSSTTNIIRGDNNKFNAKTTRERKFVKLVSKYREPDDKEVFLDTSTKNVINWSSNGKGGLPLYADKNVSPCEDNTDMDFNDEYGTDYDSLDVSSTTHTPKPEFGCNACGKSASSPEALSLHVCSA